MHKAYFSSLSAASLLAFGFLFVGAIALLTDPVIEYKPEIIALPEGQDEFQDESADYLLLLPPKQEVAANRAPSPDIDYRLPKNIDELNYLAVGQDLTELLRSRKLRVKLQGEDAFLWSDAILDVLDKDSFKSPQRIMLLPDETQYLDVIKVPLDAITYIEAKRGGGGFVTASQHVLPTHTKQRLVTAEINRSFYDSAVRAGLPKEYLERIIYNYSFDVDFQRDVKKGDLFEILYETVTTDTGRIVEYGDILFMNLVVDRKSGGKAREMFLYNDEENGKVAYFDKSGVSVEKSLLKTPVSGARLSSGFGYRRHPILGYNKLHQGVDFVAPTGTPIYAAGGGVVEYAGRFSSYGKYIRIRHGGKYKTVYAHLSRFAKGIKKGVTVEQKQIIGYVGSTGRSTGPHLHYEIRQNGKALNPSKLELPSNTRLEGEALLTYQESYRYIKRLAYDLRNRVSVARNGISDSEIVKGEL